MAVGTQPGVHGLADAADLVEGRGVVIGPAKVQHLGAEGASGQVDGLSRGLKWRRGRQELQTSPTFGLS